MSIYTRHFLRLFLARFLWLFVLIQVFVGLCAALVFLVEHPYVPIPRIARGLPDLVLLLLPISLTLAFLLGSVLFLADVRSHRGLLRIQLAGRDPRRYQVGILVLGGLASLLLWWLHGTVLPQARFHERYLLPSVQEAPETIAMLLERKPRFFRGFHAEFGSRDGNDLSDFSLLTTDPGRRIAITAERASLALSKDRSMVRLEMREGRLLELDEADALTENLGFERLELALDATRLSRPSKSDILDLKYYTNAELASLPEQASILRRHGIVLREKQKRRVLGITAARSARLQSALNPLLCVILVLVFLGAHVERGFGRRVVLVVLVCLVVLQAQQILLETLATKQAALEAWMPLLPSLEVVAGTGALYLWRRSRRGARE